MNVWLSLRRAHPICGICHYQSAIQWVIHIEAYGVLSTSIGSVSFHVYPSSGVLKGVCFCAPTLLVEKDTSSNGSIIGRRVYRRFSCGIYHRKARA